LTLAQSLREKADDPDFQRQWREVKAKAKAAAMAKISALTGVQLPANSMLDVQVGTLFCLVL
jgi:glucan phosphorylase